MKLYPLRITKGKDLKKTIAEFVATEAIKAGVVVSAAGSLSQACLRLAGASGSSDNVHTYEGPLEIVSLMGMCQGTMHLHIAVADKEGKVTGGHLKDGCIVRTTVELFIAADEQLEFSRELDPQTGFDELKVKAL